VLLDLTASRERSRLCRVPNVVFISDACRALPADLPTSSLGGISILPLPKTLPASESETDVFFAAPRPESPWRSPTNAAKTAFKSLFTKSYSAAT
jgi:hypothetical protein